MVAGVCIRMWGREGWEVTPCLLHNPLIRTGRRPQRFSIGCHIYGRGISSLSDINPKLSASYLQGRSCAKCHAVEPRPQRLPARFSINVGNSNVGSFRLWQITCLSSFGAMGSCVSKIYLARPCRRHQLSPRYALYVGCPDAISNAKGRKPDMQRSSVFVETAYVVKAISVRSGTSTSSARPCLAPACSQVQPSACFPVLRGKFDALQCRPSALR